MKKVFVYFMTACSVIAVAAACAKENISENITRVKTEKCCFGAGISGPADGARTEDSKTLIDGGISGSVAHVKWLATDALSSFSLSPASGQNNKMTCAGIDPDNNSKAVFEGEIDEGCTEFVAFYPYGENVSYSNGIINAAIPHEQSATAESFSDGTAVMIARATRTPGEPECGNLTFANLCSAVSFTLPDDINFARTITVTSKSGVKMSGNVTVDCNDNSIAMSSDSYASVVLSGSFEGGKNYCVTMAPGTYENGFRFEITSTSGNKYVRETSANLSAAAGEVYPLGKLSLALDGADITSSLTIAHNYSSNTLNGSTATIMVQVNKPEFAAAVKNVTLKNVKLTRGGEQYCSLAASSQTPGSMVSAALTNASTKPYLPSGTDAYSYSAELHYTVGSTGGATVERTINLSGKASSPVPDANKFTLAANLNAYTSYSCYKGTDGQSASASTANGKDGSTIYGIGASYKSGLSPAVYNQCSSLLTITSKLDGNAASGDKGGQRWAAHTVSADLSFDGTMAGTSSKTVYVTGLPFRNNPPSSAYWTDTDYCTFEGSYAQLGYPMGKAQVRAGKMSFSKIYVPESIGVTLATSVDIYTSYVVFKSAKVKTTFHCKIAGSEVITQESPDSGGSTGSYSFTKTGTITGSDNTIYMESSYTAVGPYVRVKTFELKYQ